ncbi:hypothetical protein DFS34DRAFT_607656 [Phlyctochytrium arcticum]|nr:hypothetical protein DFS34DRAFT_607656 [Phlyctochytrium arcticum]
MSTSPPPSSSTKNQDSSSAGITTSPASSPSTKDLTVTDHQARALYKMLRGVKDRDDLYALFDQKGLVRSDCVQDMGLDVVRLAQMLTAKNEGSAESRVADRLAGKHHRRVQSEVINTMGRRAPTLQDQQPSSRQLQHPQPSNLQMHVNLPQKHWDLHQPQQPLTAARSLTTTTLSIPVMPVFEYPRILKPAKPIAASGTSPSSTEVAQRIQEFVRTPGSEKDYEMYLREIRLATPPFSPVRGEATSAAAVEDGANQCTDVVPRTCDIPSSTIAKDQQRSALPTPENSVTEPSHFPTQVTLQHTRTPSQDLQHESVQRRPSQAAYLDQQLQQQAYMAEQQQHLQAQAELTYLHQQRYIQQQQQIQLAREQEAQYQQQQQLQQQQHLAREQQAQYQQHLHLRQQQHQQQHEQYRPVQHQGQVADAQNQIHLLPQPYPAQYQTQQQYQQALAAYYGVVVSAPNGPVQQQHPHPQPQYYQQQPLPPPTHARQRQQSTQYYQYPAQQQQQPSNLPPVLLQQQPQPQQHQQRHGRSHHQPQHRSQNHPYPSGHQVPLSTAAAIAQPTPHRHIPSSPPKPSTTAPIKTLGFTPAFAHPTTTTNPPPKPRMIQLPTLTSQRYHPRHLDSDPSPGSSPQSSPERSRTPIYHGQFGDETGCIPGTTAPPAANGATSPSS